MTVKEALEIESQIWAGYTVALTPAMCAKIATIGNAVTDAPPNLEVAEEVAVLLLRCLRLVTDSGVNEEFQSTPR